MKLEGAVLNETCHMKVKAAIITYMRGGGNNKADPFKSEQNGDYQGEKRKGKVDRFRVKDTNFISKLRRSQRERARQLP